MAKEAKHVITIEMNEWQKDDELMNDAITEALEDVGPESTVEDVFVGFLIKMLRKKIGYEIMDMTLLEAASNKEKLNEAIAIVFNGRNNYNLMPDNLM